LCRLSEAATEAAAKSPDLKRAIMRDEEKVDADIYFDCSVRKQMGFNGWI
jgi:hypothetical protein